MEKPILFNTEMVKAILDGRKTMTRRKIDADISNQFDVDVDGSVIAYMDQATGDSYKPTDVCKYQPGDILWVRETWTQLDIDYRVVTGKFDIEDFKGCPIAYRADHITGNDGPDHITWHPSIHMPRAAARLFLRVQNVRVERLQDITDEQIASEGVIVKPNPSGYKRNDYRFNFSELWNSTIKKYDYGSFWQSNPWVWVIEFERVAKES